MRGCLECEFDNECVFQYNEYYVAHRSKDMQTDGVRCLLLALGLRLSGNMRDKLQRIQEAVNVMPDITGS